jgi:hypothetical protein
VVASDLTSATGKYVIIKGCQDNSLLNSNQAKKPTTIDQILTVQMGTIKNPYSVRDSEPFIIEVYKNWDSTNGPQNMII